jgi:hypothetical protein
MGRFFDDTDGLMQKSFACLIVLTAITCGVLFLPSPGTLDVDWFFLRWMDLMRQHGLTGGYAQALSDSPPGAFLLLFGLSKISTALGCTNFLVLKTVLTLCAFLSASILWLWSRNLALSTGFAFALLLSSAAQGYLDILPLPFLLLSLWALQKRRLPLSSFFFALAFSFKWQPAILGPFFLVSACELHRGSPLTWRQRFVTLVQLAGGAMPVALFYVLIFPPTEIRLSFLRASSHTGLSMQGLNLNWIIQYFHYKAVGLVGSGKYFYDHAVPDALLVWTKRFFIAVYAMTLLLFIFRGRGFLGFLWFALTGYLAYCVLNVGVHENHFFLSMIMAFLIAAHSPAPALRLAVFAGLSANLNLYVFYGQNGRVAFLEPTSPPAIVGASLSLAALNTLFLILCCIQCCCKDFNSASTVTAADHDNSGRNVAGAE